MSTAYRLYISETGLGNEASALEAMRSITEFIDYLNQNGQRANLLARVLLNAEEAEDEGLDLDKLYTLTSRVFPVLWFNITYDLDSVKNQELRELEDRFALRLLSAGIAKHNTPY